MAGNDWKRIVVHDFVVTHFLKKSGWALHAAGPSGLQQKAVLSSKELAKLFKEGKAALFLNLEVWNDLVAKGRGKKSKKSAKVTKLLKEKERSELLAQRAVAEAERKKREFEKRRLEATSRQRLAEKLKNKLEKAKKSD